MGSKGIEVTTDEHGRYRLVGLPKGRKQPDPRQSQGQETALSSPRASKSLIHRGSGPGVNSARHRLETLESVIEGFGSTDKSIGRATQGVRNEAYHAYDDKLPTRSTERLDSKVAAWVRHQYQTEPDGTFRELPLPGRVLLAAINSGGGSKGYSRKRRWVCPRSYQWAIRRRSFPAETWDFSTPWPKSISRRRRDDDSP